MSRLQDCTVPLYSTSESGVSLKVTFLPGRKMGVRIGGILASLLLGWFVVLVLFLDFVALQLI